MTRRTTTVYYWPTETGPSVQADIRLHEREGWYVHQIASVTFDGIDEPSSLFVVYAKDES
jgi:hypothetical protein